MRTALVGLVLVALAGAVVAQPGAYSSDEGKYRAKFLGAPKTTTQTADTAVGELTVAAAVYAKSDGSVFLVSHTDFPAAATKPANHGTLFDGVRDGVKGKGKLIGDEKTLTFGADKLPMREFVVEKEKKLRVKCRVILRENRIYQILVIGTPDFIGGKEATTFLDSFELK